MRVALVLIPETAGDPTAAEHLAAMASEAGWSLVVADDPIAAMARLREVASANGSITIATGAADPQDALVDDAGATDRINPVSGPAGSPDLSPPRFDTRSAEDEHARLYEEVRQGRELLQVTLSSIGEAVVTTDIDGRVTFMNGVAEAISGWRLTEAIGRPLEEIICVVDAATAAPLPSPAMRVFEHGAIVGQGDDVELVGRDGSRLPIDESASPIRDAEGTIRGIVMVIRDVTDRKRAELERGRFNDEIALQRARLRSIVMSVPGVVWEAWGEPEHERQRIDFVSDYVETMLGYSVDEWLSTPNFWLTIVHPDDRDRAAAEAMAIFASGTGGTSRFRWMRRDGMAIWVESQSVVVCDANSRPVGMRGVTLDVTQQVTAEQELRAHGERLELLHEVGRVLSAELDLRTLVQTVTDAATRLCGAAYGSFFFNGGSDAPPGYSLFVLSGVPREMFAHMPMPRPTEIFAPTYNGESVIRIDDVTKDPRYGHNSPYYGLPPGHVPVTSYLSVPVVSRSGEVLGGLFFGHPDPGVFTALDEQIVTSLAAQAAIAMDNAQLYQAMQQEIEERRRAQEEMMSARDEAEAANRAKDQFLAVLSHELRTPLTPVLAVTHVLENDDRMAADQRPLIEMIRRNIELEARLIDDLLDLTRISKGKLSLSFETVDIHRLINSVASICRGDVNAKRIELHVDLQARDHFIRADSARIQQVLWNLVKNAIKFTPEQGRITIRTRNDRPGHVRIEVIDTGIGIDPAVLPRIFNAFDQGTVDMRRYGGLGLGLSISRSLVEMHGGTLSAMSDGPGLGSTFALEIDTVVRLRVDSGVAIADGLRRAVRVLIVDDHIETSKVMKLLLERRGYVVQAAHTLHDALEATRTSDFDLLISDIGLPDGSGLELMRALADRPIRGIALSGFGMDEDIARSKEAGFVEHLIKPVSFQSLQETIGRVLG
jgi:PAS domain S-box-containing protein